MDILEIDGVKIHKWEIGPSVFLADIRRGARLMNWHVKMADGDVRDIIFWPENANFKEGFAQIDGGNPILFPFCGSSFSNGREGFWTTPGGVECPMKKHGYANSSEFEIIKADNFGFTAKLLPNAEFRAAYPYDCEFLVSYRFGELSIICDLTLKNNESGNIPWAAGHHFYFKMPWLDSTLRRDYALNIESKKQFTITPAGALLEISEIEKADFGNDALINRIFCKLKSNKVSFGPKNGEGDLYMRVGQDVRPNPWTTVVTWTRSADSQFYCVEPWMGPPNSVSNPKAISYVAPKSSQTFSIEVSLV